MKIELTYANLLNFSNSDECSFFFFFCWFQDFVRIFRLCRISGVFRYGYSDLLVLRAEKRKERRRKEKVCILSNELMVVYSE